MFHKITLVGEVTFTKWFLAFIFPCFTMTYHMVIQLTFERKICLTNIAFKLSIVVDVLVQGKGTGGLEELIALFALKFVMLLFEMVISFLTGRPP